jgi:sulfite exporter TauE/SafE
VFEDVLPAVAGGIALGISTGVGCVAWCVPALAPSLAVEKESARAGLVATLTYNGGRMAGYAVAFAAAAALGGLVPDSPVIKPLMAGSMFALGVLMFLYAAHVNLPSARLCHAEWFGRLMAKFPFVAGLLVGLSPCPPLLAAIGAAAGHGAGYTLLFGGSFACATSAFVLPLGLLSQRAVRQRLRSLAEVGAVFAGLWFVAHGVAVACS